MPDGADRLPLTGTTIVEVSSGIAGPLAALRLRDLGADVVKVEPEEGDWTRGCPPFLADGQTSATFAALNRGKRVLALGRAPAAAAELMRRLLARADVVITDRTAAELETLGIQPATGRTILVRITGMGDRGPLADRPASELIAQAMAGYTRYLGSYGEAPRRLGADMAGTATAIFAVQAVLAALLARGTSTAGQTVTLSLVNSLLSLKTVQLGAQSDPDTFEGPRVGAPSFPPLRGWATADEPIMFSIGPVVSTSGGDGWGAFIDELGLGHLRSDARFDRTGRNSTGIGPRAAELREEYEAGFRALPAATVIDAVQRHGGMAERFLTYDEVFAHPQTAALGLVHEIGSGGSATRTLGFPARFSTIEPRIDGSAPVLGEHNAEVARELGCSDAEIDALVRDGALATTVGSRP